MKRRTSKPYSYYSEFKAWTHEYLGSKCNQCNSTTNLEIDHIDRLQKTFNLSKHWSSKSLDVIKNELAKCQLLCEDCHKVKTKSEIPSHQRPSFTHGKSYAWMRLKCKCVECSKAKRLWYDDRNKKRRKIKIDFDIRVVN